MGDMSDNKLHLEEEAERQNKEEEDGQDTASAASRRRQHEVNLPLMTSLAIQNNDE